MNTEEKKDTPFLLLDLIIHAKLLYGDLEGTKADLDASWKTHDTLEGVENGVNAVYYGVASYHYMVGLHANLLSITLP